MLKIWLFSLTPKSHVKHFVSLIIILLHDLIHYNFACRSVPPAPVFFCLKLYMSTHVFLEVNIILIFPRSSRNSTHIVSYFPFPLPVHLHISATWTSTELFCTVLSEQLYHS